MKENITCNYVTWTWCFHDTCLLMPIIHVFVNNFIPCIVSINISSFPLLIKIILFYFILFVIGENRKGHEMYDMHQKHLSLSWISLRISSVLSFSKPPSVMFLVCCHIVPSITPLPFVTGKNHRKGHEMSTNPLQMHFELISGPSHSLKRVAMQCNSSIPTHAD